MNAPQTMAAAMAAIPEILIKAGLTDGSTLEEDDQIRKATKPIFWFQKVDKQIASNKSTFVRWSLGPITPTDSADDGVAERHVLAYVDVWTSARPDDSKIERLAKRICDEFEKAGWGFELNGQPYFDSSSKRYQLSYSAEKVI